MLKFEIVSWRTVEVGDKEKKYVAYMLQVRQDSTMKDPNPSNVERRYNQFLDLYTGLKKDFPTFVQHIHFPKKALMGNFDENLIRARLQGFESLLEQVASESKLRETPAAIKFFSVESDEAKRLLAENATDCKLTALPILENSLKLLNKIYTDRSRVVLLSLCRIVACGTGSEGMTLAGPVQRWASLALHRYKGVSDSDLLQLYVPLLQTCIELWERLGLNETQLVAELNDMRKRGMKVDLNVNFMDAINTLEEVNLKTGL